jgi:hypothetical protein
MPNTIFFSWQADTETTTGRNFIERSLERAASRIGHDTDVEDAARDLSIDRDTKDVPGSPPIVETIFQKIDKASVFVPDLTFVGSRLDGRPMPNPNVLIEYGWALKSLGHGRIVPIMNTAFGAPSETAMPFNLRHLRNPILYHCEQDADDETRKRERETLAKQLEHAIRLVLAEGAPDTPQPQLFQPQPAAGGPGRFRSPGQAVGMSSGDHVRPQVDVFLPAGPIIWLRLMPAFELADSWSVTELMKIVWKNRPAIDPLCYMIGDGIYKVRADDGFGVYSPLGNDTYKAGAISFVYKTGEIWGINLFWLPRTIAGTQKYIPDVEELIAANLRSYGALLREFGVPPPYAWMAGMEDTRGRVLYARERLSFPGSGPRCAAEEVTAKGNYSPPEAAEEALRPFFNAIFDACGREWPGPQFEVGA